MSMKLIGFPCDPFVLCAIPTSCPYQPQTPILIPHNGTTKSGAGMRKQHTANFKAKVVQEFLKEDKTITQIAAE